MVQDDITILCTGDLHLGRHPTQIPGPLDGPELSPTAIWRKIAQKAIDRDVDAVIVTGDVADRENQYFEAYGAFEDGASKLNTAGIPIIAVSGNHDFDVFPRIVRGLDLEHLHLLGEDGEWDYWTLTQDEEPLVRFDGWSFPSEHVYDSPLTEYDLPAEDSVPQIGVMHADLGSRESQYAPVQPADLRNTAMASWLLGHIHSPGTRIDSDPLVLYPGSPQPLDPGEPRAHGPWILTVEPNGTAEAEQIPLASLRYDPLEISVEDIDDPKGVAPVLSDQLSEHVRSIPGRGALELLLARVRLTGRTEAHAALVDSSQSIREQVGTRDGTVDIRIEDIQIDTRPAIALDERAQGDDAVATIATLLLELEEGELSDENERLLEDSLKAIQQAHSASAYTALRQETDIDRPTREDAAAELKRQARTLLDTLLEQKEAEV